MYISTYVATFYTISQIDVLLHRAIFSSMYIQRISKVVSKSARIVRYFTSQ